MNVQYIIMRPIYNVGKKGRKEERKKGMLAWEREGEGGPNEDLFGADETKEQIGRLI
jgi:hypothetical protein